MLDSFSYWKLNIFHFWENMFLTKTKSFQYSIFELLVH